MSEINSLKVIEVPLLKKDARPTALTLYSEQHALRKSDVVVCVSNNLKSQIETIAMTSLVKVVPNGVDTTIFNPRRFRREEARKELGLVGKFVFGYTGSYQNWHNLDLTLQIASILKPYNGNFHFLLIGNGKGYSRIKDNIVKMGLASMFTQIDKLPHEQMPYHLMAFDCALMTYPTMDGFYFSPLKMFEYMAMEIPVLTTAIGQIADIIAHGQTGLLVDIPTPECFTDTFFKYRAILAQIGRQGRLLVEHKYNWHVNARKVIAAGSEAIKHH